MTSMIQQINIFNIAVATFVITNLYQNKQNKWYDKKICPLRIFSRYK